jgi:hypothetical protein
LDDSVFHHVVLVFDVAFSSFAGKWLDMRADRAFQVHKEATATVEQVKAMYSGNCFEKCVKILLVI